MTQPQAGWYPDPSGNTGKLRYWNGEQWTDDYMDYSQVQQPQSANGDAASVQAEAFTATTEAPAMGVDGMGANAVNASAGTAGVGTVDAGVSGAGVSGAAQYSQTMQDAQSAQATYQQAQPVYAQATYVNQPIRQLTDEDNMLRLIAFIFCIIGAVTAGWALIPLAWMIPMTVHAYGIWKGTKANTVAFGVCTLIFVNVVAGILLLISTKDN